MICYYLNVQFQGVALIFSCLAPKFKKEYSFTCTLFCVFAAFCWVKFERESDRWKPPPMQAQTTLKRLRAKLIDTMLTKIYQSWDKTTLRNFKRGLPVRILCPVRSKPPNFLCLWTLSINIEQHKLDGRLAASKDRFTHSMPFPCRAHAVPLPCHAAKCLECVFPIWFTQCGRVWFTRAMPCFYHAVLLKATPQHGLLSTEVLCCGLEKNGMVGAWNGHGMVWQVWIRHGRTV